MSGNGDIIEELKCIICTILIFTCAANPRHFRHRSMKLYEGDASAPPQCIGVTFHL
jgi:hypothetical protein